MINNYKKYFLIVSLLLPILSFGNSIYVATTGSDTGGDGSEENPYATIQTGLQNATVNDTVMVASGIYVTSADIIVESGVTLKLNAGVEVRFDDIAKIEISGTLIANGEENNVIKFTSDNQNPNPGDWQSINLINSDESVLRNCIIQFASYSEDGYMYEGAITCDSSSPLIEKCVIENNGKWGIVCHNSSNPIIQYNDIRYNGWDGIKIHNDSSPHVLNNKIYQNGTNTTDANNGIIFNSGGNPVIQKNLIYHHSGAGIKAFSETASNKIIGNTIVHNETGIYVNSADVQIQNSIIWMNHSSIYTEGTNTIDITYSSLQEGWIGEGNTSEYPHFIDPENGDYHLHSYSPCVDAGNPDIDGDGDDWQTDPDDRDPDGTRLDMGAFFTEYQDTTGNIVGSIEIPEGHSGYLWYGLWFPGMDLNNDDPHIGKDSVEVIDGVIFDFTFERVPIGDGYVVQSILDQTGSPIWGPDGCDQGYDLIGGSDTLNVSVGIDSEANFNLVPCDEYIIGDYSLSFDGNESLVKIDNATHLNSERVTVAAWIYPFSWNESNVLIEKGIDNNQFVLRGENNQLQWIINDQMYSVETDLPSLNTWTHIAGTYNGSVSKIYINHQLVSLLDVHESLNTTSDPLFIGASMDNEEPTNVYNGLIHDVAIWERNLNETEIYQAMGNPNSVDSLVGYWPLDHGFGQIAYDESTNEQHGTIHHGDWDPNVPDLSEVLPDLGISLFQTPETAYQGQNISDELSLEIFNVGSVTIDSFYVAIYLSADSVINPEDDLFVEGGREKIYNFAFNDTIDVQFYNLITIPNEFEPGNWYIGPFVDENLEILESSEENNWTSLPIEIILSNEAPYIVNAIEDITVLEDEFIENISLNNVFYDPNIPDGDSLQYSVNSSDSSLFIPTLFDTLIECSLIQDAHGQAELSITATDMYGLSVTDTVFIDVLSVNDPPVLTSPIVTSATEDEEFLYITESFDPDGDIVTYNFENLPTWLQANADSVFGVPLEGDLSTIFRVILDDGVLSDTVSIQVDVTPVNDPPVITSSSQVEAYSGINFVYQALGSDPEDSTLTWIFEDIPEWLTAEADSAYGVPPHQEEVTSFNLILSDGELNDTLEVFITIVYEPLPDLGIALFQAPESAFQGQIIVDDLWVQIYNLGTVTIDSFYVELFLSSDSVINPLEDMFIEGGRDKIYNFAYDDTIDVQFDELLSIPSDVDPGDYYIGPYVDVVQEVLEYNEDNNWTSLPIEIILSNEAPYIVNAIEDITVLEDEFIENISLNNVFYDPNIPDGDSLQYSVNSSDSSLFIPTLFDTLIECSLIQDAHGQAELSITATDMYGLSVTDTVFIDVLSVNDPPVLTSPIVTSATEDEEFLYITESFDPDGDIVTYNFENLPTWLQANADSVFGVPLEGDLSTIFRVILDDGVLSDTVSIQVDVTPVNDPPVIISASQVEAYSGINFVYQALGSDPEDSTLTWIFEDLPEWLTAEADSAYGVPPYQEENTSFNLIVSDGELTDTLDVFITIIFGNSPPVASISSFEPEVHDTVISEVQYYDQDGDTLTCGFFFSLNEVDWTSATVDTTGLVTDTSCGFIWNNGIDLADTYSPLVWFQAVVSDGKVEIPVVTGPFSVDNFVGVFQFNEQSFSEEVTGNVEIPFEITDQTEDTFSVTFQFSIDDGNTWNPATIIGNTDNIGLDNYIDTLIWNSLQDIPNTETSVRLFGNINDGWDDGVGDTVTLQLDNETLPIIISFDQQNKRWNESITFQFSEELDHESVQGGVFVTSNNCDYEFVDIDYQSGINTITLTSNQGWAGGDSISIELSTHITNIWGNPLDGNENGDPNGSDDIRTFVYVIEHIGDYDQDALIGFDDLVHFQQTWWEDEWYDYDDIGPSLGVPPYLQPTGDGIIDFEDLMVFVQMWNWSAGFNPETYGLTRTELHQSDPSDPVWITLNYPERSVEGPVDEFNIELHIKSEQFEIGSLEFCFNYNPEEFEILSYHTTNPSDWISLINNNQSSITFNMADLSLDSKDGNSAPIIITCKRKYEGLINCDWSFDGRNYDGNSSVYAIRSNILDTKSPIPDTYTLYPNYPNPFNPATTIQYDLPKDTHVTLTVYNLLGQNVLTLVDKIETFGSKTVVWNGVDEFGKEVSAGLYFVIFQTKDYRKSQKIILLK